MQPENGTKTWQWIVTVIVIVALIVIGIFVFGNKKTEAPTTGSPSASTTMQSAYRIIMNDQFPGNVVYISSVQASAPVWVAIHRDNNGVPGAVIGSAHFDAGINPGKITLTSPTVDGGTYYAVMYQDNGSGKFLITANKPVTDENGNTVMKIFHASVSAGTELKG